MLGKKHPTPDPSPLLVQQRERGGEITINRIEMHEKSF